MAEKKQEKKEKGAQSSSNSHKAGIVRNAASLPEKKLRRVLKRNGREAAEYYANKHMLTGLLNKLVSSGLADKRRIAAQQRAVARLARRIKKIERRKRSVAAKKAAATRRAKKLAAQAAQPEGAQA